MRELNTVEMNVVSGGCGPGMFDGLFEGLLVMVGIGVVGAFALGAASVVTYQYASQYFYGNQ